MGVQVPLLALFSVTNVSLFRSHSKTAAAIRKQSPVVVRNLLRLMRNEAIEEGYDGYASCPLTTAYGKVLMAEFIYGGKVTPTFPLDPRKERKNAFFAWFNRFFGRVTESYVGGISCAADIDRKSTRLNSSHT